MKRETPREKVERLLSTVPRPFVIKINGIWTVADGVYLRPVTKPYPIKCVYNGRFVFVSDNRRYFDFLGYDELTLENFVIERNIQSLPKLKSSDEPKTPRFRSYTYTSPRLRVVPAEPTPENANNADTTAEGEIRPLNPITTATVSPAVAEFLAYFENQPITQVAIPQAAPIINPQDPPPPVTPTTGIVERIEPARFDPMPYIPLQVTPDLPTPNTH